MPTTTYREELLDELESLPDEYVPFVLQVTRSFKQTLEIRQVEESIRQGLRDIAAGRTYPISTLWDRVDAE